MRNVIIVGCGYVGSRVALRHKACGDEVLAIVRSEGGVERMRAMGVRATVWDLDSAPLVGGPNCQGSWLYYFVPPPGKGEADPRVRALAGHFNRSGHPHKVVYLSTTGVYGDCGGQWIDENQPLAPNAARSRRRVDAESCWRAWREESQGKLAILRVGGIYGPGRLPLRRLKEGLPLLNEAELPFTNRIHVDDLVEVCVAAMDSNSDEAVYNVSDGHPSTMGDYFDRIADLAGLPRPPRISRDEAATALSAGMMDYMNESRRLSNHKLRQGLGIGLRYPILAEGLPACLEVEAKASDNDQCDSGAVRAD